MMVRVLLPYLRRERNALLATAAVATLARLCLLADPQILRLIVDQYVLKAATLPRGVFVRGVVGLIAAVAIVGMLARTLRTLQEYWTTMIGRRVGAAFYGGSLAQALSLPYEEATAAVSGARLHTIERARLETETTITGAAQLGLGAVAIVTITAYAFLVHPVLGLLHLVGLPAFGAALLLASRPIRARERRIAEELGRLAGSATESIRNVEIVRGLGAEPIQMSRLEDTQARILERQDAQQRLVRRLALLEGALFHTLRATLLLTMLVLLYAGSITAGQFLTLFIYSSLIFTPLADVGHAIARYQASRGTFDALADLQRLTRTPAQEPEMAAPITSLRFSGVSFAYDGAPGPAVRDLDLEARAGETIALTGPSGAGKSTVVKLAIGLLQPTAGTILVNGRALDGGGAGALRARVGIVTQDTQLFEGAVRDNLRLGRPDATDEACRDALARASADLSGRGGDALDLRIGEGGVRLSGGERQRLAIARAVLRQPDVFVFDEPTSHLDAATEADLLDTIRAMSTERRIVVLVSHRLSVLTHADRIYVLANGAVEEQGRHGELLERGGRYAALWAEQHRGAGVAEGSRP